MASLLLQDGGDLLLQDSGSLLLQSSVDFLPGRPRGTFHRPAAMWTRVWRRRWRWRLAQPEPVDTLVLSVGDSRDYAFDFSGALEIREGATISTVAPIEIDPLATLVIGTPAVSVAEFDDIAAGEAVVVRISGAEDETDYTLACRVVLDTGRDLVVSGRAVGVADYE